jgi:hypothetical protein
MSQSRDRKRAVATGPGTASQARFSREAPAQDGERTATKGKWRSWLEGACGVIGVACSVLNALIGKRAFAGVLPAMSLFTHPLALLDGQKLISVSLIALNSV